MLFFLRGLLVKECGPLVQVLLGEVGADGQVLLVRTEFVADLLLEFLGELARDHGLHGLWHVRLLLFEMARQ